MEEKEEYTKEEVLEIADKGVKKVFRLPVVVIVLIFGVLGGLTLLGYSIKGYGDNDIAMRVIWFVLGSILIPASIWFARFWWKRQ